MKVLFLSFFLVLSDQLSKLLVKGFSVPFFDIHFKGLDYGTSIDIIGNFFKITYIENPGMAFGLEVGGKLFRSIFTIFASIIIVYFIIKNKKGNLYLRVALAFILGGALGNLVDRLFYGVAYNYAPLFHGNVVDFLHFDFPDFSIFGKKFYSWPIFDLADIWVSVGFILIILGYKKITKTSEDKLQVVELESVTKINPHSNEILPDDKIIQPNEDNFK